MNPLLALVIQETAKVAPVLIIELIQVLSKENATEADWDALKARYAGKKGSDYFRE